MRLSRSCGDLALRVRTCKNSNYPDESTGGHVAGGALYSDIFIACLFMVPTVRSNLGRRAATVCRLIYRHIPIPVSGLSMSEPVC